MAHSSVPHEGHGRDFDNMNRVDLRLMISAIQPDASRGVGQIPHSRFSHADVCAAYCRQTFSEPRR